MNVKVSEGLSRGAAEKGPSHEESGQHLRPKLSLASCGRRLAHHELLELQACNQESEDPHAYLRKLLAGPVLAKWLARLGLELERAQFNRPPAPRPQPTGHPRSANPPPTPSSKLGPTEDLGPNTPPEHWQHWLLAGSLAQDGKHQVISIYPGTDWGRPPHKRDPRLSKYHTRLGPRGTS